MANRPHPQDAGELTISVREGEVMKAETWSETHISGSSSGGGGYVGPQGGQVNAPRVTIHSETVENLRVFVKFDDGTEDDLKLKNWTFGFREGNRVRIAYESGTLAGITNLSSSKTRIPFPDSTLKSLRKRNVVPKRKHPRLALIGTVLAFASSALAQDMNTFGPVSNLMGIELMHLVNRQPLVGILDLYAELGFLGGFAVLAVPIAIGGTLAASIRVIKRNNKIAEHFKRAVGGALAA